MKVNPKPFFTGFRARVFWSGALVVAVLFTSLTGLFIYQHRRLLKSELIKRGESLVDSLAHRSELGTFAEDKELLRPVLQGLKVESALIYAGVFNIHGKIIASNSVDDN